MEYPKTSPTDSHLQLKNILYYYQQKNAAPFTGPAASPNELPDRTAIAVKTHQVPPTLDRFAAMPSAQTQPSHSLPEALAHEEKRQRARLGRFLLTVTASWLGLTLLVALLLRT